MLFRGQGVTVSERPRFDGQQQREALTTLQRGSGKDATTVAQEVHLSYPQYNRYLWGRIPLRVDQFESFAKAYGVTPRDLVDRILSDPWTMRDALRGHVPESDIDRFVAEHEDDSIENQKAHSDRIKDAIGEQRESTKTRQRRSRPA